MKIRPSSEDDPPGAAPSPRPTVLLLHGFGQAGAVWSQVIERLGSFDCLAPDLRGHGSASDLRPVDSAALIDDVAYLASDLTRPILVGYSMGGRIAMRAVLADPSLFGGLVLISTTAGIEDPDERARRRDSDGRLADLLERGETEDFETAWRSLPLWQGDPDWVTRRAAELRAEAGADGLAESLRGYGSGSVPPVWNDLGAISLPTAVLAGDRDSTYCELADRLATALPDCVYAKVRNCGHSIPIERPDDVALAIEGISRRLRPGGS